MLPAAKQVRDMVLGQCSPERITLEIVANTFVAYTALDRILYVSYDTPVENPIWGRFHRWRQNTDVYGPVETVVEVAYPEHLNEPWRRLIVCKELCHALEDEDGQHNVSDRTLSDLVDTFSIYSARGEIEGALGASFTSEMLAEMAAVEILFPLDVRKAILNETPDGPNYERIAGKYEIPVEFVRLSLTTGYMSVIQDLLE